MELKLYYATNRRHVGRNRLHPSSYGTKFSDDGMENLRFGVVTVQAEEAEVSRYLSKPMKDCGIGDGEELSATCAKSADMHRLSPLAPGAQVDAYGLTHGFLLFLG